MQDDLCVVCAEPLLWVALGSCGHKETCSRCVARLRSVLKDERCVYCQQALPAVFVTRFMGDYTQQQPAADVEGLQARAKAGELKYLDSAQAFFDDAGHYQEIASLCSYTHPKVWEDDPGGKHRTFKSLQQLKQHLQQKHSLQFCGICLEGRKVFLAEQCLYSKSELDRHMTTGDLEGPMAESGFKGHPECRFCRKRFYGENELFTHMHTAHEQCFLCKRANPNRFVYYRDYPDLENHFRHDHHLCSHPNCLEQKFVVFATEQELRTHSAREHGGEMSRAEKRQALTIPLNFSYRRGGEADQGATSVAGGIDLAAAAAAGRAITIGGGAGGSQSRFARRGGGGRGNLQQDTERAVQASLESAHAERAMRHSASQPNLQSGGAAPSSSVAAGGQQQQQQQQGGSGGDAGAAAAASGASGVTLNEADFPLPEGSGGAGGGPAVGGRWAGAGSSGVGGGGALRPEDFPALPGMSKGAKKKAKQQRSLAQMLAGGGGSVRVVNVGGGGSGRPAAPSLRDDASFPTLRHSTSAPSLAAAASAQQAQRAAAAAAAATADAAPAPEPEWQEVAPPRLSQRQLAAQKKLEAKHARDQAKRAQQAQQAQLAAAEAQQQQQQQQQQQGAGTAAAGAEAAAQPAAEAGGGGGGGSSTAGISEALRAANKALVERIKRQLDASQFATFRQQSMEWMKGGISSPEYHRQVAALGLVSLVPDLAATCPDAGKRAELLAVHKEAFAGEGAQPAGPGGWVPPEAAAAAAAYAEQHSSWQCGVCTLLNAPSARNCEACGHPKPRPGADAGNQWRQQQQQQQGVAGALRAEALDPSLPTLQAAAGAKGKKASKGRAAIAAAAAAPQPPPPAAAAPGFSFSAAAAKGAAVASFGAASGGSSSSGAGSSVGGSRPGSSLSEEVFPSLGGAFPALGGAAQAAAGAPSSSAAGAAADAAGTAAVDDEPSGSGGSKKKGKQKKQPKFERLRLTGGDPATKQWLEEESRKVHPQNAWTQGAPAVAGSSGSAPQVRGVWAGKSAGKLAQAERAMLDAWGRQ